MSKVLPILFNTDMVQAILDGRKTETRRLVKRPYFVCDNGNCAVTMRTAPKSSKLFAQIGHMPYQKDPYIIGDILYVRETWRKQKLPDGKSEIQYRADFTERELKCYGRRGGYAPEKWHPSIHMPKEAARIWLRVTDVKVERLQDMKPEDIRKEGMCLIITPNECKSQFDKIGAIHFYEEARKKFSELWNSTLKKSDLDLYGWDANPWVWVIEFERCEKPESEEN